MEQITNKIKALLSNQENFKQTLPQSLLLQKKEATDFFLQTGFPSIKDENWKHTRYENIISQEYEFSTGADTGEKNLGQCNIPLNSIRLPLLNGFYKEQEAKLTTFPNGVIAGSFAKALEEYPQLVEKYYGKALKNSTQNGFLAINTALSADGLFIYVPENVQVEKPMQMLNMIFSKNPLFIQTRNLVILEKNSSLQLIHCDDSYNHHESFSNHTTEIFVGENARIEHYKMQNLNDNSGLMNFTFVEVEKNGHVVTHAITLNGGLIRNQTEINLNGEGAFIDANGLYILDKDQKVDNIISIKHKVPHCQSFQLYKGILDDNGKAAFKGHILVLPHAVGTQAFQSNKNLLLTEKAKIVTNPFLEIYNDDVKCSHGATTGQLDTNALFYIRSRGISKRMAEMLLMSAYCNEVLEKINIDSLKEALAIIVEKRLNGNLRVCGQCSLNCATSECDAF